MIGHILAIFDRARQLGISVEPALVNGEAGLVARDPLGRVASVISLEIADGEIQTLRGVTNPDKLRHLGAAPGVERR